MPCEQCEYQALVPAVPAGIRDIRQFTWWINAVTAKPAPKRGWEAFAQPTQINQRRYEAVRAYVLEGAPLAGAAAGSGTPHRRWRRWCATSGPGSWRCSPSRAGPVARARRGRTPPGAAWSSCAARACRSTRSPLGLDARRGPQTDRAEENGGQSGESLFLASWCLLASVAARVARRVGPERPHARRAGPGRGGERSEQPLMIVKKVLTARLGTGPAPTSVRLRSPRRCRKAVRHALASRCGPRRCGCGSRRRFPSRPPEPG